MKYFFCFYHIYQGEHINYHHVIIETDDLEEVQTLEAPGYQYILMSSSEIFLTERDMKMDLIKSLMMDGESLLKRLKKYNKEQIFKRVLR